MLASLMLAVVAISCSLDERLMSPLGSTEGVGPARPVISSASLAPGNQLIVAIDLTAGQDPLSALQGTLRFDPARLGYIGQPAPDSLAFPLQIVNASRAESGELTVLSLNPAGLATRSAILVFEVRATGYESGLSYTTDQAATVSLTTLDVQQERIRSVVDPTLTAPAKVLLLKGADWSRLETAYRKHITSRLIDSVPAGRRYGDVDSSGAINIIDGSRVGNWSVGNQSPAGSRIPVPSDMAELAGNVAPQNGSGLGEAGDPKGPGWDANCVRMWDILDAANISNEAVGNDRPVVGELVPADAVDTLTKLPRRGSACAPSDTLPPTIPSTIDFPDDSLYTINNPTDTINQYYRRYMTVQFERSATPNQIYSVLTKYRAEVVGGISYLRVYIVRIPEVTGSWDTVKAKAALVANEPGVRLAWLERRRGRTVEIQGRLPDDGPNRTRQNWAASSPNLWNFLAVRAPMAWGCETGLYGGPLVRIGLLEVAVDTALPDLAGLSPVQFTMSPDPGAIANQPILDTTRWHGGATAALLTGRGDDSKGIAGMIWHSDLRIYALNHLNVRGSIRLTRRFIDEIIPRMIADKPRIVSSQVMLGDASDPADVALLRDAFHQLFTDSPNTLWISATGNKGVRASTATFPDTLPLSGMTRALLGAWDLGDSAKILFVAGTQIGNRRWGGSNFLEARTQIAAPADNIQLPGIIGSPGSSGFTGMDGTSFAAPMVAGVAAQLLSMDSSLSPVELKAFIVQGALQQRMDSVTGAWFEPNAVDDMPDNTRQLDAYGALTLLSRSRRNTPICGLQVTAGWGGGIAIQRNMIDTVSIGGTPVTAVYNVSVAQGGRILAADNRQFLLSTQGVWSQGPTANNDAWIQFLERDTAYIRYADLGSGPPPWRVDILIRIRSEDSARNINKNLTASLPSGTWSAGGTAASVSPTGSHVYVEWNWGDDEYSCGTTGARAGRGTYLIPLRTGGLTTFQEYDGDMCAYPPVSPAELDYGGNIAWAMDGARFALATNLIFNGTSYGSRLRRYNAGLPDGSPVSLPGRWSSLFAWSQEGGRIRHLAFTPGGPANCWVVDRDKDLVPIDSAASPECVGNPVLPSANYKSRQNRTRPKVAVRGSLTIQPN